MYNSFGETLANEWNPKTVCESRADWLKFEDLSNGDQLEVRCLQYKQPRQESGLCCFSFARYSPKCIAQIYRALYAYQWRHQVCALRRDTSMAAVT